MILGMMRIAQMNVEDAEKLILKAVELGITTFDHADIYGGGKSEEIFGEVLKRNPDLRKKIKIQTKCGICNGYYDSSKEHIIESVNNSLKRLNTTYVDTLLIHRPDILTDMSEIAEAFNILYRENKVNRFGVSNMSKGQIEMLKKQVYFNIEIDQIQLSLVHSYLIDEWLRVNMSGYVETGLLEYLKLSDMEIQVWSPLMANWEDGCFIDNPKYQSLNDCLDLMSKKYNVSKNVIAISWINMLPFNIEIVLGTTNINRLIELSKPITLEKKDWYTLYLSNNKQLP